MNNLLFVFKVTIILNFLKILYMINSDKIYFIKNKNKYLPSLPVITQLN